MKKLALVLAGGGGKGAYQIGVWKALKEFGVDRNIAAVSGTSVGALNATLFLQGDYEIAEQVWMGITSNQVLQVDPFKQSKRLLQNPLMNTSQIIAGIAAGFKHQGVFSREGLLKIIHNHIQLASVSRSPISCYATCCRLPMLEPTYFKLNGCGAERIVQILLASSALPIAFDSVEIDDSHYMDGGLKDNVPIQPLYDDGYRVFLVVHLKRDGFLDKTKFPDARFIEIIPSEHQGDLIKGTLDFGIEGATRRIEQGYRDALTFLQPMYDMGLIQENLQSAMGKMRKGEERFKVERTRLLSERESLKEQLSEFLFD